MKDGKFEPIACIGKACDGFADVQMVLEATTKKTTKDPVYKVVRCCPLDNPDFDMEHLIQDIEMLRQIRHENCQKLLDLFIDQNNLCLLFPLMDYGSVADVIHSRFIFGLPELAISLISFDVLKALEYLHANDLIHRSIRCSHILISSTGYCVLSGFHSCISMLVDGKRLKSVHELPVNSKSDLLWMAPEMLQQNLAGYTTKADIYSLGIAACEMANGFPPFSDMEPMQMLLEKLRGTSPRLLDSTTLPADDEENAQRDRVFSKNFHAFVELCWHIDPRQRPTAVQLMHNSFFKQALKHKKIPFREILKPLQPFTVSKAKEKLGPSVKTPKIEPHHVDWDF